MEGKLGIEIQAVFFPEEVLGWAGETAGGSASQNGEG